MRPTYVLAISLALTTLVACTKPTPTSSAAPASPRLAEVLVGTQGTAGAAGGSAPSARPSPETPREPTPAGSSACQEARARRGDVATHLAEVRQTRGVAEARALDRASAALAACEAREDCVDGDPRERAARVLAVEEARTAFRVAGAGLQKEELGQFEADRAVLAACGVHP